MNTSLNPNFDSGYISIYEKKESHGNQRVSRETSVGNRRHSSIPVHTIAADLVFDDQIQGDCRLETRCRQEKQKRVRGSLRCGETSTLVDMSRC